MEKDFFLKKNKIIFAELPLYLDYLKENETLTKFY